MAARDHQADAGIDLPIGMRELAGVKVAFEVIDGDERNSQRECQCLGGGQPDDKCPDQPRPRRHGDRAQIAGAIPARRRASSIMGKIWRTWARDAISGTTPPYRP